MSELVNSMFGGRGMKGRHSECCGDLRASSYSLSEAYEYIRAAGFMVWLRGPRLSRPYTHQRFLREQSLQQMFWEGPILNQTLTRPRFYGENFSARRNIFSNTV